LGTGNFGDQSAIERGKEMKHALLPELMRWQMGSSHALTASRWTKWAQQFCNRFAPRRITANTLLMIWRITATPFVCNRHWTTVVQRILPQIRLSIAASLPVWDTRMILSQLKRNMNTPSAYLSMMTRTSILQDAGSKGSFSSQQVSIGSDGLIPRFNGLHWSTIFRQPNARAMEFSPARVLGDPLVWPGKSADFAVSGFEADHQLGTFGRSHRFALQAADLANPLHRVFHRLKDESAREFHYQLIAEKAQQNVRRVLRRLQRTEEGITRSIVLQQPSSQPMSGMERMAAKFLVNRASDAEPTAPPAAMPTIDIDRLTERVMRQIDQRIIAYRERFGKVF